MTVRSGFWSRTLVTLLAWTVAMAMFFPIFWTVLTSFKTEGAAIAEHGLLFFLPTLDSYTEMFARADYFDFALNSLLVSVGATLVALALAIPAAYSMAFHPTRRTRGLLLWMLSTKMLPPVGVLMPIYVIFRTLGMLDTRCGLILIDALMNLPLVVWMLFTFFKEIPRDILEAGRMDGARVADEIVHLLLPLALPGVVSTSLLSLILCWNEAFWSLTLTSSAAAPLAAFIASFSSPEGLFFAKLSAASTVAVAPILVFGWLGQRQMVRGLTFGAVK
jgi:sorbitol/mannitol transport system permease protein